MNENIRPIVLGNKTEPFCIIEPFHCTFSHATSPSFCSFA
jgi:hypothetical protein